MSPPHNLWSHKNRWITEIDLTPVNIFWNNNMIFVSDCFFAGQVLWIYDLNMTCTFTTTPPIHLKLFSPHHPIKRKTNYTNDCLNASVCLLFFSSLIDSFDWWPVYKDLDLQNWCTKWWDNMFIFSFIFRAKTRSTLLSKVQKVRQKVAERMWYKQHVTSLSCKSSVLWSKLNLSSINMSRYLYLSRRSTAWPLTTLAFEIDHHVLMLSCKNEFSHHWTKSTRRSKAAHLSCGTTYICRGI